MQDRNSHGSFGAFDTFGRSGRSRAERFERSERLERFERLCRYGDSLHREDFDQVAHLQVVVVLQADAAFEPGLDL